MNSAGSSPTAVPSAACSGGSSRWSGRSCPSSRRRRSAPGCGGATAGRRSSAATIAERSTRSTRLPRRGGGGPRSRRRGPSAPGSSAGTGHAELRETRSNTPRGSMAAAPRSRSGSATSRCSAGWPAHQCPTATPARCRSGRPRHGISHMRVDRVGLAHRRGSGAALCVAIRLQQAGQLRGAALGVVRPGGAAVQQERGRPSSPRWPTSTPSPTATAMPPRSRDRLSRNDPPSVTTSRVIERADVATPSAPRSR